MPQDNKALISVPQQLKQGEYADTINVNGVEISWDITRGICTFRGIPVALMWVDSTLAGVMSGMESMIGAERFNLALQSEGRKSVESDWLLINSYSDFQEGFAQLNLNAKVAGWGDWQLVNYRPEEKKCLFRVYNNWEGAYQKALNVCWGSGMIAGKLAGICTKQFQINCWAIQTCFVAKGEPYDEFIVAPSTRNLEQEIENLLISDQATRADMAVALKKLRDTEKVLQESNQRYNLLAQRIPDGIYIWRFYPEGGGRFDYLSPRFCLILGLNAQEVLDDYRLAFMATHPEDLEQFIFSHETARITLQPFRWEGRFIVHGKIRWIRIASDATLLPNGSSVWNGVISDITERHQAAEQLQKSEAENIRITRQLENIAWLLKPKTFIKKIFAPIYEDPTKLNKNGLILSVLGSETIFNILSEFMGMLETSSAVYEINGDYAAGIFSSGWCQLLDNASYKLCQTDNLQDALTCGKWLCHESCWREATQPALKSGTPNDIECAGGIRLYAVPIYLGATIIGGINFGYGSPPQELEKLTALAEKYHLDLDELQAAAHEYQQRPQFVIDLAQHRLAEAAKLIGLLVSGKQKELELEKAMIDARRYADELQIAHLELESFSFAASHDLQEPSRIILNYVDALEQDLGDNINDEVSDDLRFIQDSAQRMRHLVQDLESYMQMKKIRLAWKLVDLKKCLIGVIRQLQSQIEKHQAQISFPDLPVVWGDENLLTNAIRHLVENAIKFHHPEILPTLEISAQQNNHLWEIRFDDNGIGVEPQHREIIFLPFKRLNRPGKYHGSGLGLPFVKEIARRHHGAIRVESSVRHGSVFILSIPVNYHK